MSNQYKDRFTEAEKEQHNKSAFVCESCKKSYKKEDAEKQNMSCCGRTLTELMQESFGP